MKRRFDALCLAPIFLALLSSFASSEPQDIRTGEYMGSQICGDCHPDQAKDWQQSHHAHAWKEPSADTVHGDFDNAEFHHLGRKTRFFRKNDGYFIETTDYEDAPKILRVRGVGGISPLQQYLVETEPGRLQSFDVVWDQERRSWYHLYPEQALPPDDGFHWSGPYKTWNARCAECHATGFKKNYSLAKRLYQSEWAELGVGCEACHGPGQAHVAWASSTHHTYPSVPETEDTKGFSLSFSRSTAETEIQQCAGCHARREPFDAQSPRPGTPFHDAYRLALLREGLYHPDGQILDEVYVYGSFLQSKMYQSGVRCTKCHQPHSGELVAEGNGLCTQCHSPAGNATFPTLALKVYDNPSHHFHPEHSESSRCVSCHMIERTYMGIDGRRDHSFRIPRPDLSLKTGAPNACTDCHVNQTASWAAKELALRFPQSSHRGPHFGELFAAARSGLNTVGHDLLALASQPSFPAIIRASALDLLARAQDPDLAQQAAKLLSDPEPLVRAAAVSLQQFSRSHDDKTHAILRALEDPVKSVRIAAARQLLALTAADRSIGPSDSARRATREWQASIAAKSDFPETHMVLGGAALTIQNTEAAIAAFEEATRLDPQLVDAWVVLIRLHVAQQDMPAAQDSLQRGLLRNPSNRDLQALKHSLSVR